MKKLLKEDILFIKEILNTPYETLLQEIKTEDYKEKKLLIEQIEFYKKIYQDKKLDVAKNIVIELIKELEEVNGRIERLEQIRKTKAWGYYCRATQRNDRHDKGTV